MIWMGVLWVNKALWALGFHEQHCLARDQRFDQEPLIACAFFVAFQL
jgi:hypothetical protein